MQSHNYREVKLTAEQQHTIEIANCAFLNECPFFAHLSYSIARYVFTLDVPTAATDGRHLIINPVYFCNLKVGEQVFVLAHEMWHLVSLHPQRHQNYQKDGTLRDLPYDPQLGNIAMDYVINADIIKSVSRATCNPDWLYDPEITGDELWEDVYEKLYKEAQGRPQQPQGPGQGKGGGKRRRHAPDAMQGQKGDQKADANGGQFDDLFAPPIDPATGTEDLPDKSEFQDCVARAAASAKAMGSLPASMQRLVDEILDPQVDWRDHIRLLVTSKIGSTTSTWNKLHRRRLVFDPIVIMPGKTGYGADTVVVGIDTSGSIGEKELNAFLAEVKGVLADCRPRRVIVIGCDAAVTQVDELNSLDDFEGLRAKGVKGGGGTNFCPVFEYVSEHDIRPDTLIYLTDLYGRFPSAPNYPVVWAATSNEKVPFGEVVRLKS